MMPIYKTPGQGVFYMTLWGEKVIFSNAQTATIIEGDAAPRWRSNNSYREICGLKVCITKHLSAFS